MVDCETGRDCAYTSIATGMHDPNGEDSNKQVTKEDFLPKGRMQAQLRMLASRELAKRPSEYGLSEAEAKTKPDLVATAGHWADSVSLHALANASASEFRIWAWDAALCHWNLYVVAPTRQHRKIPVVWLRFHWRWALQYHSQEMARVCGLQT